MAIIYTYPVVTPAMDDLFVLSSKSDGKKTRSTTLSRIKETLDVVDSIIAGAGIAISESPQPGSGTGDITISNTGVLSLSNAFGTYISGIANTGSTGNVDIGTIDLSAVDGTAVATTKFLSKDNTWDIPPIYAGGAEVGYVPTGGDSTKFLRGDATWEIPTDTTYTAGDGLDLTGTEFSTDLKANGGLVIESTELAVNLGASAITGTLAIADGGTGLTAAGQPGEVLSTNASSELEWIAVSGTGTVTNVTSTTPNQLTVTNGTTTPALTVVTGSVTNNSTSLATGADIATFIQSKGYITGNETITLSGDITGTGTTAITTSINNEVVDFDMLNTGVIDNASEKQASLTGNEQVLISTPPPTQGQLPVLNKLPINDIAGLVSVPTVTATSPITATPGPGTTLIEIGDIPVSKLNSGTNATKYTYWQGNGQWSSPSGYTPIDWQGPEVDHYTITNRFDVYMFTSSSTFELSKMTILVNATGGATYTAAIYSAAGLLTASGSVTPSSGIVQITNIFMDSGSKPKFDAGGQYYVAIMTTGSANTTSIAGVPHLMGNTVGGQLIGGSTSSSNLPVANNLPTSLTDPELILNTLSSKFACTLT